MYEAGLVVADEVQGPSRIQVGLRNKGKVGVRHALVKKSTGGSPRL
jgi:hypothetical protein